MAFSDSKPHYALLDGLRGVAAMLVVWYHVFEGFQFAGNKPVIDFINHGYLAVDFFFMLSGFVIGYAYDNRWGKSLTMGGFFHRRLIRLHPMVMLGALIGAISFPLYIVHYPLMYAFYMWLIKTELYTFSETWPIAISTMACSICIAWLSLRFYDEPIRKWLNNHI